MTPLKRAGDIFDRICDVLAVLAGVLTIFLMLLGAAEITMRSTLGQSIGWGIEISEYGLLFITFLATAWLLRYEGHVKMDIVLMKLKPRPQAVVNITTSLMCAILCFLLTWYGGRVTWDHFQTGYLITSSLRPPSFLIQFIIPIGFFLLFIQFLRRAHGYLGMWRAPLEQEQRA